MKTKTVFVCSECGYLSRKWLGKCPDCQSWNSFDEETVVEKPQNSSLNRGRTPNIVNRAEKFSVMGSKSLEWTNHGLWMLQIYYALLIFEHADFVDMMQGGTHFPLPGVLALRCQSGILA